MPSPLGRHPFTGSALRAPSLNINRAWLRPRRRPQLRRHRHMGGPGGPARRQQRQRRHAGGGPAGAAAVVPAGRASAAWTV